MKTQLSKFSFLLILALSFTNCQEKAKKASTGEAEEAAVSESSSEEYTLNTSESQIEWKGFKPTGTHTGTIELSEGNLTLNAGQLKSGSFTIDMNSIVVTDLEGDQKASLEAHLMGTVEGKEGDFFNVNKYPEAKFEITDTEQMEGGKTTLSGNLTMKGNTQNISFPATINSTGEMVSIKSESFTIDRTQWNINYGSKSVFDNLGDKFINDDMELKILVKAKKS